VPIGRQASESHPEYCEDFPMLPTEKLCNICLKFDINSSDILTKLQWEVNDMINYDKYMKIKPMSSNKSHQLTILWRKNGDLTHENV
jgi:hypothetical protein